MKFKVYWSRSEYGTSKVEANSKEEAKVIAEESIKDFGDPNQFIQDINTDDCWQIYEIEEIE